MASRVVAAATIICGAAAAPASGASAAGAEGFNAFAQGSRCGGAPLEERDLCKRIHKLEPSLPIHPPFDKFDPLEHANAEEEKEAARLDEEGDEHARIAHAERRARRKGLLADGTANEASQPHALTPQPAGQKKKPPEHHACLGGHCLPFAHVLGAWHTFEEEALIEPLLKHANADLRKGSCFNHWDGEEGAGKWVSSFGEGAPESRPVINTCNSGLSWYPAFAGRFLASWSSAYWPCKEEELKKLKAVGKGEGDYYRDTMWPKCRMPALAAHDKAVGTGGVGKEATPPYVMRTLYGNSVKLITVLRNPVDRLETAFWQHKHYPEQYGNSSHGLHAYVEEQTGAFTKCEKKEGGGSKGARRCAFLFEMLGKDEDSTFFHADQVIRSIYEPFVHEWHAAFGPQLLVMRAEDLLHPETKEPAQAHVLTFLGLATASLPTPTYTDLHHASLVDHGASPMFGTTRHMLETFFDPHNRRLAELLRDGRFLWSTPLNAEAA